MESIGMAVSIEAILAIAGPIIMVITFLRTHKRDKNEQLLESAKTTFELAAVRDAVEKIGKSLEGQREYQGTTLARVVACEVSIESAHEKIDTHIKTHR
jgi:hypothetical protein